MPHNVLLRLWSTLVGRLARSCPGLDVLRRAKQLWSLLLTATSRLFGSTRISSGHEPDLTPIGDAPTLPSDPRPMIDLDIETSAPISHPVVVLCSDSPHSQSGQHIIHIVEASSDNARNSLGDSNRHGISDEEYHPYIEDVPNSNNSHMQSRTTEPPNSTGDMRTGAAHLNDRPGISSEMPPPNSISDQRPDSLRLPHFWPESPQSVYRRVVKAPECV